MADKDELLSHNYDGIEEYDNDLPRWWIWLFWVTIAFGVFRVGYYHFGPGKLQEERLVDSMAELEAIRAAHRPPAGKEVGPEQLLALVNDPSRLEEGKKVYAANCIACHLDQGQGLVGPNLTDSYWIHGGTISDIQKVVINGVPEKGMVPWKEILTADQINAVTAYIWTLHGTNPPNPKAPQGELVQR
jgi:cytochrome c oxidase cbb3-type subunit 3